MSAIISQIVKFMLQAAKRVWNLPRQIVKTQISALTITVLGRKKTETEKGCYMVHIC